MTKEESDREMKRCHTGTITVSITGTISFTQRRFVTQGHTLRAIADYAATLGGFAVVSGKNPWFLKAYNQEEGVLEVELFSEGN